MRGNFFTPNTIAEALELKSQYPDSIYIAGGSEINRPQSHIVAENYISTKKLNLNACVKGDHNYIIGASTTLQELIDWEDCLPALRESAQFIFSRNVRNIGTVGGNIGAHLKDSYLVPILLVLEAKVELGIGVTIPLAEYLSEKRSDLILNVIFSHFNGVTSVKKIAQSSAAYPTVFCAVAMKKEKDKLSHIGISVSGMKNHLSLLKEAEEALLSGKMSPGKDFEALVSSLVDPVSDIRGSEEYKRYLSGVVVSDCVARCLEELK